MSKLVIFYLSKIVLLSILLLIPVVAIGNTSQFFVDSLLFPTTGGDMLSNTIIDNTGTLWLANYGGYIYRYNGAYDSTGFKSPGNVLKQDKWDRVWTLKIDDNDRPASGFMDLKTGKQKKIVFRDVAGNLIEPSTQVSVSTSEQELWLLTDSGELYSAILQDKIENELVLTSRAQFNITGHNLKTSYRRVLEVDSNGKVWLAAAEKLLRFNPETAETKDFSRYLALGVRIDFGVYISITKNQTTWVALAMTNQLLRITPDDRVFNLQFPQRIHNIQYDKIRAGVWCASTNGLYFLRDQDNQPILYQPTPWQDAGIPSTTIRHVDLDKDNNLWITSAKGVHVIRDMHKYVRRIVPNASRGMLPPSPINQVILTLTKQNEHILWWTNRRQELVRYDKNSGKELIFPIRFRQNNTYSEARSIAFSNPYILIITNNGDLIKFDTRDYTFKNPELMANKNIGNSNTFIDGVPNREGKLWLSGMMLRDVSSANNQGEKSIMEIAYWDADKQLLEQYQCQFEKLTSSTFEHDSGFFSYYHYKNNVWIVPWTLVANIFYKISFAEHRCESIHLPGENLKIDAIVQTDDDSLWFLHGSYVKKLNLVSGAIEYSEKIPVADIDLAIVDENNNLLIYGDTMLWRYKIKEHFWEPLFVSETTIDFKTGIKPFFDWQGNYFYFLSHQGILEIDTRQPVHLRSPRLAFTSLQLGNKKIDITENKEKISIPYGESIKISYLATPLVPSNLSFFRYRLSADDTWINIARDKQLTFNHLSPGVIALEMQVSYDYNQYGNSEFLYLNILPPWWRSTLAYLSYVCICLLAMLGTAYWYRARERLRNAQLMVGVFENTSEGICVLSSSFEIIRINQAMYKQTGWLQYQNIKAILQAICLADQATDLVSYITSAHFQPPWQGETFINMSSDNVFFADMRIDQLGANDVGHYILVLEDISERREQQQKLLHLARHDVLTNLPNRLYFNEFIKDMVTQVSEGTLRERYAIVMFDLDDFKTVNDSLGHEVGDALLQAIATDLKQLIAQSLYPVRSEVFRHSGDEFLIITPVPQHKETQFIYWLQKILSTINRKRIFTESELSITASLGVTFFPDNSTNQGVLLQQADMAMYLAKKQGKSKFSFYNVSLEVDLRNRIEIEKSLNNEIEHNGLILHYQPKVSVQSGKIVGVEALSRWQLMSMEMLFPGQFLQLIRPGNIEKLFGLKVITQACHDAEGLLAINPNLKISINISPQYLGDLAYIQRMCSLVEQSNIPASNVIFEILEDVGIENGEILKNLIEFRNRKIAISIDDFGTGYSSLSHLHQLAADELKIDKSFLENIPGNSDAEHLFKKIMDLVKNFSTVVTCEGVETKEHLDFITASGCDVYQGYYFSKPLPLDKVSTLIFDNQQALSKIILENS